MINLFRNNLFFSSLLMLPYALLLRSHELTYGSENTFDGGGVLYTMVDDWVGNDIVQSLFTILLIFFQAWSISYFVNKNKLANEPNLISGVFYILLVSFLPEFSGMSPVILANTFLIFAYGSMSNIYRKPQSEIYLFNTGALIGIASLFYFPFIVFIFLGFLGIFILNAFKLKNVLQFVAGYVIPIFLSFTYLFYFDNAALLSDLITDISLVNNWISQGSYGNYILIAIALLIMLSVFSYNGFMIKKSIQVQKKVDMVYWILLLGLISNILVLRLDFYHLQITAFPLAILLSLGFLSIKNKGLSELLHLVLLGILFALHFHYIYWP